MIKLIKEMNKTRYILLLLVIIVAPNIVFSHEDNASRVEFWKKYYNPKIENDRSEVPSIDIELKKIGSHYQLRTVVNNFAFTPEQDGKNNNSWMGYGKLFLNGKYTSRIYSEYYFIRNFPEGDNEIKVILSSNMDHDISQDNQLISDTITFTFPEYNFAEARAKEHARATLCEFSEEGLQKREQQQSKGLLANESSEYLQCRYDSRDSTLSSFTSQMTRLQKIHHQTVLESLEKRIALWKRYENNKISLKAARTINKDLEDNVHITVQREFEKVKR